PGCRTRPSAGRWLRPSAGTTHTGGPEPHSQGRDRKATGHEKSGGSRRLKLPSCSTSLSCGRSAAGTGSRQQHPIFKPFKVPPIDRPFLGRSAVGSPLERLERTTGQMDPMGQRLGHCRVPFFQLASGGSRTPCELDRLSLPTWSESPSRLPGEILL